MMGMANIEQIAHGIQLRIFSRCFVIADAAAANRVAFISADIAFVPGGVTEAVIAQLNTYYNNSSKYSFANVMISATHTHSGPGGYCASPSSQSLFSLSLSRLVGWLIDWLTKCRRLVGWIGRRWMWAGTHCSDRDVV